MEREKYNSLVALLASKAWARLGRVRQDEEAMRESASAAVVAHIANAGWDFKDACGILDHSGHQDQGFADGCSNVLRPTSVFEFVTSAAECALAEDVAQAVSDLYPTEEDET